MTKNSTDGWMPPRGGGYRPGSNTAAATPPKATNKAVTPPKGGAGVSKAKPQRG